jgi:4-aminobutyrate aminotransferase-like enzyme/Ser/Thr protein kinase RdoA (MazF antagonist)
MQVKFALPQFTEEEALHLAREGYGITGAIRSLPSERDQNFHLRADSGEAYVLKISNIAEPVEILDLQNQAMARLAERAPDLAVPRVVAARSGQTILPLPGPAGGTHHLRLLTYIPGRLWTDVRPHTPKMLHSLGRAMGAIDRALEGFAHGAATRRLKWDVAHASWIRDYLAHLGDPARRTIVERRLLQYESQVLPRLPNLRKSVIYNDANDANVLVSEGDPRTRSVIGVIDFGDLVHSQTIGELAVACAYGMMGQPDPVSAGARIVAGYHEIFPLTEAELEVLHPLICIRLCVSVTNSAYQRVMEPGNAYLTISERPAWDLLRTLAPVPDAFAHYVFRAACGLPPCPVEPVVANWLRGNPGAIGRVIGADLRTARSVVFDLGVGSTELGGNFEFADPAALTDKLFDRMRAEDAAAGIGRYDEARPLSTAPRFRIEGNAGPEWRTIHLGLDLFLDAGSPVFAALDGIVHARTGDDGAPFGRGATLVLEHAIPGAQAFYTLYRHLDPESLGGMAAGRRVRRGEPIGAIGGAAANGGWPPHLHFQIVLDLMGHGGDFPGEAPPGQRQVWLGLCPDPNLILGLPVDRLRRTGMAADEILGLRRRRLGRNLSIAYRKPIHIVRGSMQYLYDQDGRQYLDAVNNVPHVGHCHPRVVKAGQRQMAVLNTNTRYLHENVVRYAERLVATLPEPLRVVYFVCSGSEANELALRLARTSTRSKDTIVVDLAYHGNSGSLIEVSPYKYEGPGGHGPEPFIHKVPVPDAYRGLYRGDPEAGVRYAQHVADAIGRIRERGGRPPVFLCESMMGSAGQIPLAPGYLREAYRHVRAAGGLCIADEVQVGLGRVGSRFWGFELQGVVPDIVTMGKPIGNGHPLAAVVTTPEIADAFDNGMEYFNTFGGNPVSCAIGEAVLDVIEQEGLQAHALDVGGYLMDRLRQLQDRHAIIGDVRGAGLFIGVELVRSRETLERALDEASYVVNRMKERGILLSADFNSIKIKPPLVFTRGDADFLAETLDLVLQDDFTAERKM